MRPMLLALIALVLPGCAFIDIPLDPGPVPFEEVQVYRDEGVPTRDKVLLLEIEGTLLTEKESGLLSEGRSVVSDLREKLQMASKDPSIKAVLLRVNSPGGTVSASDMLYEELRRFKEEQGLPVVACFLDVAASGGYYASMAADYLVALPTSVTGSIGVIMQLFGVQDLMGKVGVESRTLTSGPMKDAGSPFRKLTDGERALMQSVVDEFYQRFVSVVDDGRSNLSREQVLKLADGRIYTGAQALEAGLVDQVGYLPDAIDKAKKLAGIQGCRVVSYRRGGEYTGSMYAPEALTEEIPALLKELKAGLMTPQFLYMWCPGLSLPL